MNKSGAWSKSLYLLSAKHVVEVWTAPNLPGADGPQPIKTITAQALEQARGHAVRESKARQSAIVVIRIVEEYEQGQPRAGGIVEEYEQGQPRAGGSA